MTQDEKENKSDVCNWISIQSRVSIDQSGHGLFPAVCPLCFTAHIAFHSAMVFSCLARKSLVNWFACSFLRSRIGYVNRIIPRGPSLWSRQHVTRKEHELYFTYVKSGLPWPSGVPAARTIRSWNFISLGLKWGAYIARPMGVAVTNSMIMCRKYRISMSRASPQKLE